MSEFLFSKAGGPHHERKTLQKNLGFSTRLPAPADRFAACLRGYGAETVGHAQVGPLQYGDGCRSQKILKNKTVSNYSAEDLNAILGISPITDDSS